jgi:hypothetical protein
MMILISLSRLQPGQLQTPALPAVAASGRLNASAMASTYVPMESWVYPAIERLAAAGFEDEHWRFPLFSATPQRNLTATFRSPTGLQRGGSNVHY